MFYHCTLQYSILQDLFGHGCKTRKKKKKEKNQCYNHIFCLICIPSYSREQQTVKQLCILAGTVVLNYWLKFLYS